MAVNTRIKTKTGKKKLVEIGVFDENGLLETDDPRWIALMSQHFERADAAISTAEHLNAPPAITCKYCQKPFDDRMEYLRHCRKEHSRK